MTTTLLRKALTEKALRKKLMENKKGDAGLSPMMQTIIGIVIAIGILAVLTYVSIKIFGLFG